MQVLTQPLVCDTRSSLGMKIDEEFIVISLHSGKFFHFNPPSETFFKLFLKPTSFKSYCERLSIPADERAYLEPFFLFLTNERILTLCDIPEENDAHEKASEPSLTYLRPMLIRQGEKTLSQFEFNYP